VDLNTASEGNSWPCNTSTLPRFAQLIIIHHPSKLGAFKIRRSLPGAEIRFKALSNQLVPAFAVVKTLDRHSPFIQKLHNVVGGRFRSLRVPLEPDHF